MDESQARIFGTELPKEGRHCKGGFKQHASENADLSERVRFYENCRSTLLDYESQLLRQGITIAELQTAAEARLAELGSVQTAKTRVEAEAKSVARSLAVSQAANQRLERDVDSLMEKLLWEPKYDTEYVERLQERSDAENASTRADMVEMQAKHAASMKKKDSHIRRLLEEAYQRRKEIDAIVKKCKAAEYTWNYWCTAANALSQHRRYHTNERDRRHAEHRYLDTKISEHPELFGSISEENAPSFWSKVDAIVLSAQASEQLRSDVKDAIEETYETAARLGGRELLDRSDNATFDLLSHISSILHSLHNAHDLSRRQLQRDEERHAEEVNDLRKHINTLSGSLAAQEQHTATLSEDLETQRERRQSTLDACAMWRTVAHRMEDLISILTVKLTRQNEVSSFLFDVVFMMEDLPDQVERTAVGNMLRLQVGRIKPLPKRKRLGLGGELSPSVRSAKASREGSAVGLW